MRFFFKSRQFKIIAAIVGAVMLLTLVFILTGTRMAPHTDILGTLSAPFRSAAAKVQEVAADIAATYNEGNTLMLENAELSAKIDELNGKLADYEKMAAENETYKKFLGIKEEHKDFQFVSASIIARDSDDPYSGFTINKGSMSDIKKHDPVITDSGIVGYITEVGLTSSKVTTVLSPKITLGAIDNRSSDSGIVNGGLEFSKKGVCVFKNLARSSAVAIGDYVSTSGEGIFPAGLPIGSIEFIGTDNVNSSIYAEIKPFTDMKEIRDVMIITSFDGQITGKDE